MKQRKSRERLGISTVAAGDAREGRLIARAVDVVNADLAARRRRRDASRRSRQRRNGDPRESIAGNLAVNSAVLVQLDTPGKGARPGWRCNRSAG